MKVVRKTHEQLILTSTPWFIGLCLSACIVVSIGFGLEATTRLDWSEAFWGLIGLPAFLGLFLLIFVRRDDVVLDRSRDLLELRHATFLRRRKVQHKLSALERAKLQSSRSDGTTTYRVALVLGSGMDAGTHPVTEVYSSGNSAKEAVTLINDWLADAVDSGTPQA